MNVWLAEKTVLEASLPEDLLDTPQAMRRKHSPIRGRLLCPHAKASDLHGAMGHTWITDALGLPAAGGLGKLLDRAENGRSEAQAPHSSQIPF